MRDGRRGLRRRGQDRQAGGHKQGRDHGRHAGRFHHPTHELLLLDHLTELDMVRQGHMAKLGSRMAATNPGKPLF